MGTSTNEFREYIDNKIKSMKQEYRELTSGDIHREIGVYPNPNHSMPNCCNAMRDLMMDGDMIIREPKKGNGASLTIRYYKR